MTDLGILPGGSVWEGPGVLAQHPHQTPLKAPQADCTVLGGHQQQVPPLYPMHPSTLHAADAYWMRTPTSQLRTHIQSAQGAVSLRKEKKRKI